MGLETIWEQSKATGHDELNATLWNAGWAERFPSKGMLILASEAGKQHSSSTSGDAAVSTSIAVIASKESTPEDKLKAFSALARDGQKQLTVAGRAYWTSQRQAGDGTFEVSVFSKGSDGQDHPVYRGLIDKNSKVKEQTGADNKKRKITGDWWSQNEDGTLGEVTSAQKEKLTAELEKEKAEVARAAANKAQDEAAAAKEAALKAGQDAAKEKTAAEAAKVAAEKQKADASAAKTDAAAAKAEAERQQTEALKQRQEADAAKLEAQKARAELEKATAEKEAAEKAQADLIASQKAAADKVAADKAATVKDAADRAAAEKAAMDGAKLRNNQISKDPDSFFNRANALKFEGFRRQKSPVSQTGADGSTTVLTEGKIEDTKISQTETRDKFGNIQSRAVQIESVDGKGREAVGLKMKDGRDLEIKNVVGLETKINAAGTAYDVTVKTASGQQYSFAVDPLGSNAEFHAPGAKDRKPGFVHPDDLQNALDQPYLTFPMDGPTVTGTADQSVVSFKCKDSAMFGFSTNEYAVKVSTSEDAQGRLKERTVNYEGGPSYAGLSGVTQIQTTRTKDGYEIRVRNADTDVNGKEYAFETDATGTPTATPKLVDKR